MKGNSNTSIRWLKSNLRCFQEYTGIQDIGKINYDVIQDWIYTRKLERGWSNKTVHNKLSALSIFLNWCINQKGIIKDNPVSRMDKPNIGEPLPTFLKLEDANNLLAFIKHYKFRYRFEKFRTIAIIAMFLFTGLRNSELCNLRMQDVKLDHKTILVKSGKGNKDRYVPMNSTLLPILQDYLVERERLNKQSEYFFTGLKTNTAINQRAISKMTIKLRKASGIHFYPHLLRHTFATLMLQNGCKLPYISEMLGHKRLKTTSRYAHIVVDSLQTEIERHPMGF